MAGRFVSLEEAARLLGVSVDEVNRLVDRKKLFPMRDGATVKFRTEDVERLASDLGDDGPQGTDLALDLDLPGAPAMPAADPDEIVLGEPLDADDDGTQTLVRGAAASGPPSSPSLPTGSVFDDLGDGEDADLSLESLGSIVGISSPSLARPSQGGSTGIGPGPGDSLALNMSNVSGTGGSNVSSGPSLTGGGGSNKRSGLLDSGLSLEASGIESGSGEASVIYSSDASGAFGGDEFILGGEPTDEESASVVIPTEETGESSFFGTAIEGEGSQLTNDGSAVDSGSVMLGGSPEFTFDTPFSGLQITGLVCCSLLLLCGGFVVFDLVRTIGSAEGPMLANPVLDQIAETFGWR